MHWRGDSSWTRSLYSAIAIGSVPVIMYSRVRLGVHSVEQVLAGAFLGALLGAAWHSCGQRWARPRLFPWAAATRLGRWLRVRDAVAVFDTQLIESETARVLAALATVRVPLSNTAPGNESACGATRESQSSDTATVAPHLLGAAGIDEYSWALLSAALDAALPLGCDGGSTNADAIRATSAPVHAVVSRIASHSSSSNEQRARSAAAIAYAIVRTSDQRAFSQNRSTRSQTEGESDRKHTHVE
jgi:hypothetical protein